MRLKKLEHQGDARLRLLKLEKMGRIGDEVVVENDEIAQVHTRQKTRTVGWGRLRWPWWDRRDGQGLRHVPIDILPRIPALRIRAGNVIHTPFRRRPDGASSAR